jgi:hypothetical protein
MWPGSSDCIRILLEIKRLGYKTEKWIQICRYRQEDPLISP